MSPKWQSQQSVLLQGSSYSPRDRVTARSVDHTPDLSPGTLLFGRLSLPISERAVFQVTPPLPFHLFQNCRRNGKWAGVPGRQLLPPPGNVFSIQTGLHPPLHQGKTRQQPKEMGPLIPVPIIPS